MVFIAFYAFLYIFVYGYFQLYVKMLVDFICGHFSWCCCAPVQATFTEEEACFNFLTSLTNLLCLSIYPFSRFKCKPKICFAEQRCVHDSLFFSKCFKMCKYCQLGSVGMWLPTYTFPARTSLLSFV